MEEWTPTTVTAAIEDLREAEHSYDFVKAGSVTNDGSSVHIGTLHYNRHPGDNASSCTGVVLNLQ